MLHLIIIISLFGSVLAAAPPELPKGLPNAAGRGLPGGVPNAAVPGGVPDAAGKVPNAPAVPGGVPDAGKMPNAPAVPGGVPDASSVPGGGSVPDAAGKMPNAPAVPGGVPDASSVPGGGSVPDAAGKFPTPPAVPGGVPDASSVPGGGSVPDPNNFGKNVSQVGDAKSLAAGVGAVCFKDKPKAAAGLDEAWIRTFGSLGLHNRISYKMKTWGFTSFPSAPAPSPTSAHKACWSVDMKTPAGHLTDVNQTITTCTYEADVAKEMCAMSTSSLEVLGAFKHYGSFDVIKFARDDASPQKSYLLIYVCLMGSQNYFLTLTKEDKSTPFDPVLKADIIKEVVALGFSEEEIIFEAEDTLAIEKITLLEKCPEGAGGGGVPGGLPGAPGGLPSAPGAPGGLPSAPGAPGSLPSAPAAPGGLPSAPAAPGGLSGPPTPPPSGLPGADSLGAPDVLPSDGSPPALPVDAANPGALPGGLPSAPEAPGGLPSAPGGLPSAPEAPGGLPGGLPSAPEAPGGLPSPPAGGAPDFHKAFGKAFGNFANRPTSKH